MMENQVKKMGGECVRCEDNFGKGGRNSGSGEQWRYSGDDRQGTPPRTISASILRIPLRKQSS